MADPTAVLDDLDVDSALDHVAAGAFRDGGTGRVGLELELHLVDRAQPHRRPGWEEVLDVVAGIEARPGPMPGGSLVTVEPGGQLELSTPPYDDAALAVAALALDLAELRSCVATYGFGLAPLGTDPAREPRRVNPGARYRAMERHFEARDCLTEGRSMMSGTAALQVNLDAGPAAGWAERFAHLCGLVPVLVALSSTSRWLGGRRSGWHSMRQGIWQGIDPDRTGPCGCDPDPAAAWAHYALDAPVMLVRGPRDLEPLTGRLTFREWLAGEGGLARRPDRTDLDLHLTTLFPPVRPRGYVELRSLDAMPGRWWPAMTAVTVALADHPVAADRAAELCAPLTASGDAWVRAARDGLEDPLVRHTALVCVELAAAHAPVGLATEVAALHDLLAAGSSPAAELDARVAEVGPAALLVEACDD